MSSAPRGFICTNPTYKFGKWEFEYGQGCGCWPLKKNGEIRARAGKKFYSDLGAFFNLTNKEQQAYRIGGGCISF